MSKYRCLTNRQFDNKLNNNKVIFDTLDSSSSDRFVMQVENDKYLCKYGNSTSEMNGKDLPSYTNSPLSEYIVCSIINVVFKRSKYKAQETELCVDEKGKIFVACKIFDERLVSLFNLSKMSSEHLADNRLSYLQAVKILRETIGDEYIDYYNMYIALSIVFGNKDVHSKNFSILEKSKKCIYYDFGASLRNKLSDDGCKIFVEGGEKIQKEKILNERWTYLNNETKKQIVLLRDIQNNISDYKELLPYMNKVIDIVKKENYFIKYFDILYNNKIISEIRKEFYITYIRRNVELMSEILDKNKNTNTNIKKVMSMYKYDIPSDKIVSVKRNDKNKKFWDSCKEQLDDWIEKKICWIEGKTKYYTIKYDAYTLIIVAYDIGDKENARELCMKSLDYVQKNRNKAKGK